MTDDEKYKSLRDSLKSLRRVKAGSDFNERLFQKIKQAESAGLYPEPAVTHRKESSTKSWFANLFRPSLMPALGLTVILLVGIVIYFAYYSQLKKEETATSRNFNLSAGTDKPELVIYVKRDTSHNVSNYPHEFSALTNNEATATETKPGLDKTSSDFSRPSPTIEEKQKTLDDRISTEQKYEMERSSDVETKHIDSDKKSKYDGTERMEKKAPSNYKREDNKEEKNEGDKDENAVNGQEINAPVLKNDEKTDDTGTTGKAEPKGVILSKSKKDSLKAKEKAPVNSQEPDSTKK